MPLLIGGATTSAKHTAVKIAPSYHAAGGPRRSMRRVSVPVVENLLDPDKRAAVRSARIPAAQERDRQQFAERQQRTLVPYADAFARRFATDWASVRIDEPAFLGLRLLDPQPLEELVPYIDWSPFFQTWELRGKYPQIFDDPQVGAEAQAALRRRAAAAQADRARKSGSRRAASTASGRPTPRATTYLVYADEYRSARNRPVSHAAAAMGAQGPRRLSLAGRFHRPARQRPHRLPGRVRRDDRHRLRRAGRPVRGSRTTTISAIMAKALADRLAEAFAELLHRQARHRLGLRPRGATVARRADRGKIPRHPPGLRLSGLPRPHREANAVRPARRREGTRASASPKRFAMWPAAAVSGLYFAPSRGPLLLGRPHHPRPGRKLRRAARA